MDSSEELENDNYQNTLKELKNNNTLITGHNVFINL